MEDIDIDKVLVSDKTSFGQKNCKHFIDQLYDNHKVKPLHIMLPETSAYVKSYDRQTKWMNFLLEDDDLSLITKVKFHDNEVPDFYDKKFLRQTLVILV